MATMELYRKHGVNPLGGCRPQLVQMPIWWAMWATCRRPWRCTTRKFLWFTDLSAPDKFYMLPIVYGAFIILQQRIVPQQGMDPMQAEDDDVHDADHVHRARAVLPRGARHVHADEQRAGHRQQLVVEKIAPRIRPPGGGIVVKQVDDTEDKARLLLEREKPVSEIDSADRPSGASVAEAGGWSRTS